MQLRARDGRALLAGDAGDSETVAEFVGVDHAQVDREVDPHTLALGADLADALHEWARVADAVYRNGQAGGTAAGTLISRRGRQLAGRVAAVMGRPVSYADPLTGEVTEVDVPTAQPRDEHAHWWSIESGARLDGPRHAIADEPTPWATGLTVTVFVAILMMIVVVTLSLALGAANRWLPLIANVVIAVGLAPSVLLSRRAPVWRWIGYGVGAGIVVAWIALLFTAL